MNEATGVALTTVINGAISARAGLIRAAAASASPTAIP